MADPIPTPRRPRELMLGLGAALVWGFVVVSYGIGYFGVLAGPDAPRPASFLDVALFAMGLVLPLLLIALAVSMARSVATLRAEGAQVARAVADLRAEMARRPAVPGLAPELAQTLAETARALGAEERAEMRSVIARLEESTQGRRDTGARDDARGAEAEATLAAIHAALARMETRAAEAGGVPPALQAEAEAARQEREDIRRALLRMEARAAEGTGDPGALDAREEIRAALMRMEGMAAAALAGRETLGAEAAAAARERAEIRAVLARMEEVTVRGVEDQAALRAERDEIRRALARMEAAATGRAADDEALVQAQSAAAAERDEIRAALARMEARAEAVPAGGGDDGPDGAPETGPERGPAALSEERAEIRAALVRMETRAAAAAEERTTALAEREAAARERAEIRAALARMEARVEDPARLSETLARVEAQQASSGRAIETLLARAEPPPRPRRAAPETAEAGQASLPLDAQPGGETGDPPPWPEILRALNFPQTETDTEGFRALRRAMRDHALGVCLRSAEDVLTLLSQDGIYMDDLDPGPVPARLWIAFAHGLRGADVAGLGALDDPAAVGAARARSKGDAVFRDTALHFLRRFDVVLRRMCAEASEAEIAALGETRTGRAFMLLARVHGAFD